jgi:hypothetical protein
MVDVEMLFVDQIVGISTKVIDVPIGRMFQ